MKPVLDSKIPIVMGVLNVTPDSFSDSGMYFARDQALRRAAEMVREGAGLIDVGGESTRPGAEPVAIDEELERVIPVVESLARELPVPICVDTAKPQVMAEALHAGAAMINDINALRAPGALEVLAASSAPVCLMHMQGTPATMQQDPHYEDVIAEVKAFLKERIRACEAAGIARERLIVDPGFGFGKTPIHNLQLLNQLHRLLDLNVPLLIGVSRKSTIGVILGGEPADQRLYGSLAAAVIALWQGARIIRAHDVKPTVQALQVCHAVKSTSFS